MGTSGAMGIASSQKAQRHESAAATLPPHAKPTAVPKGIAVKKALSQSPRCAALRGSAPRPSGADDEHGSGALS